MDAVRYRAYLISGEHVLRYLPVFFRNTVDMVAQVEAEEGHVDVLIAGQAFKYLLGEIAAEHLFV